jgi:hypothetical protein
MKRLKQQVCLFVALVLLSALLYWIEYLFLHNAREVWVWIVSSVAFLPLQVALVTLVIERMLSARDRQAMLRKLNMVIGAFFGEVGIELLKSFAALDPDIERVRRDLGANTLVSRSGFQGLQKRLSSYSYRIDLDAARLDGLRGFLADKREFLLRLLENPNLLEHDTFSDALWAVFHLADELRYRPDVTRLPDTDRQHLAGDMQRAYALLIAQWLAYMDHLRADYPYLFSLALRTNPFDPSASVQIRPATE